MCILILKVFLFKKNQKKALWEGSMTEVKNDLMDVMTIKSFSKIGASFPYSLYSPPSTKKASRGAVLVAKLIHQVRLLLQIFFLPSSPNGHKGYPIRVGNSLGPTRKASTKKKPVKDNSVARFSSALAPRKRAGVLHTTTAGQQAHQ